MQPQQSHHQQQQQPEGAEAGVAAAPSSSSRSMSAPHVVGVAALVLEAYPSSTLRFVQDWILSSARARTSSASAMRLIASRGSAAQAPGLMPTMRSRIMKRG